MTNDNNETMSRLEALNAMAAVGIVGRISLNEMASRLGVSRASLYRRIEDGEVPAPERLGRLVSYSPLTAAEIILGVEVEA